jgi:hypothetical protein
MNTWLQKKEHDPTTSWAKQRHPVGDHQNAIGLRLLLRGFLTIQWRRLLLTSLHQEQWNIVDTDWDNDEDDPPDFPPVDEVLTDTDTEASTAARILVDTDSENEDSTQSPTCLLYSPSRSIDPTLFLSGLIKIMWAAIHNLWKKHQEKLHDTTDTASNPQRTKLQQHIRILHALRGHTRAIHQETYFYQDLDTFLAKGTIFQFQCYIDKYKPVILNSLVQHILNNDPHDASSTQPDPTQHPALEEAPHRKRNRRREPVRATNPITNYFGPRDP